MNKALHPPPAPPHLGRHLLAEFYDCNSNVLNNLQGIEDAMCEAAEACGATIVTKNFHLFNPYGISGVVIIAESHLTIHTWPELGYAAVDLFTCGESCDPEIAYNYLRDKLHAGAAYYSELKRGIMSPEHQVLHKPFELKLERHNDIQEAVLTVGKEGAVS